MESDKKENIKRNKNPDSNPVPASAGMTSRISNPDNEVAELKDKYLRAMAELENTRKRASTDIENALRGRAMSVAEQFLPLIDAIDAALLHAPDDEGIQILKKAADNTLAKSGIIRIGTVGEVLNPQFHNAVSAEDSDLPANTIIKEMQSGFMFGDTVLRTAMVVVSKERANVDYNKEC